MRKNVGCDYDRISVDYQESLRDFDFYDNITSKFCSLVKGKVLDAGCGNGFIGNYISKKGCSVVGVDISSGMIEKARENFFDIDFREMSMSCLDFEDESFDGVFCFQAFEHISPELQGKVLGEFYRVLKKGGVLMFNTNNRFYPVRFFLAVSNKFRFPFSKFGEIEVGGSTSTYRYLSVFSSLRRKLEGLGFEVFFYEAGFFSKWIQVWARKK